MTNDMPSRSEQHHPAAHSPHRHALRRIAVHALAYALLLAVALTAAEPSPEVKAVPTFESCGLYIQCDNPKATCEVLYRAQGAREWRTAYPPVYAPRYTKLPERYEKVAGWFTGDDNFKCTIYDVFNRWSHSFCASLVNLRENTTYEAKITIVAEPKDARHLYTTFKTLSSQVPVSRSVPIGNLYPQGAGPIVIEQSGTEQGWVRILVDGTQVIDGGNDQEAALHVRNSRFLILENLVVKGGGRHGILIDDSEHVRLINCDISGFGRVGKRNLTEYGRTWGKFVDPKGTYIDHDAGVCIRKSGKLLIERCYIHDPRGTSTSWYYTHPGGPEAMYASLCRGEVVLRYNDFIGSDRHRWNDTIGGWNNQSPYGSFHRDSDIYGNMLAFPNDDGIELDGGNMNCRVFKNKFEGGVSGISTDPCVLGPSYIFRNLIADLGDEDGYAINGIKTPGPGRLNAKGRCFYFHNTIALDTSCMRYFTGVTRNNIWRSAKRFPILSSRSFEHYDFDHDLIYGPNLDSVKQVMAKFQAEPHGIFADPQFVDADARDFRLSPDSPGIDRGVRLGGFDAMTRGKAPDMGGFEFGNDELIPYRPIPLWPDRFRIDFEGDKGQCDRVETLNVKVTTEAPYRRAFTIKQNDAFSWLKVEPRSGEFRQGGACQFKVSIDNDKTEKAKLYRAVFLIKLEDGYSLPISVYANIHDSSFSQTIEMEKGKTGAPETLALRSAYGGKCIELAEDKPAALTYRFDLPADGFDYLSFRVRTPEGVRKKLCSFRLAIDGDEFLVVIKQCRNSWSWFPIKAFDAMKLNKGAHTLKLRPDKSLLIDALKVTSEPL